MDILRVGMHALRRCVYAEGKEFIVIHRYKQRITLCIGRRLRRHRLWDPRHAKTPTVVSTRPLEGPRSLARLLGVSRDGD